MTDTQILIISKIIFYGSIVVIIYLVYWEWKKAKIKAEVDEIEMGEIKNENTVNSLTPDELVDLINSGIEPDGTQSSPTTKKPS